MTVQCCKCAKVRVGEEWETAPKDMKGPISHTYCPKCGLESMVEFFTAEAGQVSCGAVNKVSLALWGAG